MCTDQLLTIILVSVIILISKKQRRDIRHMILVSTGAVMRKPHDINEYMILSEHSKHLNCDGYEFMSDGYDFINGENTAAKCRKLAEMLLKCGKPFPTFHIQKHIGDHLSGTRPDDTETALSMFENDCILADMLGSKLLVLHLWNGMISDFNFGANFLMYPKLKEISDRYGLKLTIENVVCNNKDPMTHLKELAAAYSDILFTFDTKMSQFHGQTEELFLTENKGISDRISHFHINDYKGGYKEWDKLKTLNIGDGQVDFDRVFEHIRKCGYCGDFTIESTSVNKSGETDYEKLNRSIELIREYLK